MKIVLLNGQNHKGSTYHVGRSVADKISGTNEITEFFLPRELDSFCLGCYSCIEDDKACPFYDKKQIILEAIEACDVLIVTTPTYCEMPSAALMSFFDQSFTYWMVHRPRECMFSKRALVISTSAGSDARRATKPIANILTNWGVPVVLQYGASVQAMNWDKVSSKHKQEFDEQTDRLARKLSKTSIPTVGLKVRGIYTMMRMLHKAGWDSSPVEHVYWEEKGWLGKAKPWGKPSKRV